MTKDKLLKKLETISDDFTVPDEYWKKYTKNWQSQDTKIPSGKAWIMWFIDTQFEILDERLRRIYDNK